MFDEAHVVAGLDARHGEERHPLAGAVQRAGPRAVGDSDLHRAVRRPLPVTVHLAADRKRTQDSFTPSSLNVMRSAVYLCVAGGAVLFEAPGRDVRVFVALQTLPLGHGLADAALPQSFTETQTQRFSTSAQGEKANLRRPFSLLSSSRSVMSRLSVGKMASNILKSFPNLGMSSRRQEGA